MGDILIVDDEKDIRELVSDILIDEGYTTQLAANSEDTFKSIEKSKPKLIILDIWLKESKLDGIDILKQVKLNNPDINEYIKEAGRKAEINEQVTIRKTIGGKKMVETVPKYSLIVSHTARRSFCTNAYLSKMPTIDIMSISGHSTEREFYKYIKVTSQERAIKIADSVFFNN